MSERALSWALGLTLAALLLVVAFLQMSGPTPNPIFGIIALRSHIGAFEPYGRYLVVLAEIAAMGLPTDKGALFLLCLAIAVLAAATFFVEKAKVRAMTTKKVKKPVGAFA